MASILLFSSAMAAPRRTLPVVAAPETRSVRDDLVRLGVDAAFAEAAARRVGARAAWLEGDAYAALLQGIAVAHGVQPEPAPGPHVSAEEIQRLVQDFGAELKKLDEGLQLLASYLLRIRDRASSSDSSPPVVH